MGCHSQAKHPSFTVQCDITQSGISLSSVGISCPWQCPFPNPCASLPSLLVGGVRGSLAVSTAQEQLKQQCLISIICIPNPKYNIISTPRQKTNSIPAKTMTNQSTMGNGNISATKKIPSTKGPMNRNFKNNPSMGKVSITVRNH